MKGAYTRQNKGRKTGKGVEGEGEEQEEGGGGGRREGGDGKTHQGRRPTIHPSMPSLQPLSL